MCCKIAKDDKYCYIYEDDEDCHENCIEDDDIDYIEVPSIYTSMFGSMNRGFKNHNYLRQVMKYINTNRSNIAMFPSYEFLNSYFSKLYNLKDSVDFSTFLKRIKSLSFLNFLRFDCVRFEGKDKNIYRSDLDIYKKHLNDLDFYCINRKPFQKFKDENDGSVILVNNCKDCSYGKCEIIQDIPPSILSAYESELNIGDIPTNLEFFTGMPGSGKSQHLLNQLKDNGVFLILSTFNPPCDNLHSRCIDSKRIYSKEWAERNGFFRKDLRIEAHDKIYITTIDLFLMKRKKGIAAWKRLCNIVTKIFFDESNSVDIIKFLQVISYFKSDIEIKLYGDYNQIGPYNPSKKIFTSVMHLSLFFGAERTHLLETNYRIANNKIINRIKSLYYPYTNFVNDGDNIQLMWYNGVITSIYYDLMDFKDTYGNDVTFLGFYSETIAYLKNAGLNAHTIDSFLGHENNIIVLILDGDQSEFFQDNSRNIVALTRHKRFLYIYYHSYEDLEKTPYFVNFFPTESEMINKTKIIKKDNIIIEENTQFYHTDGIDSNIYRQNNIIDVHACNNCLSCIWWPLKHFFQEKRVNRIVGGNYPYIYKKEQKHQLDINRLFDFNDHLGNIKNTFFSEKNNIYDELWKLAQNGEFDIGMQNLGNLKKFISKFIPINNKLHYNKLRSINNILDNLKPSRDYLVYFTKEEKESHLYIEKPSEINSNIKPIGYMEEHHIPLRKENRNGVLEDELLNGLLEKQFGNSSHVICSMDYKMAIRDVAKFNKIMPKEYNINEVKLLFDKYLEDFLKLIPSYDQLPIIPNEDKMGTFDYVDQGDLNLTSSCGYPFCLYGASKTSDVFDKYYTELKQMLKDSTKTFEFDISKVFMKFELLPVEKAKLKVRTVVPPSLLVKMQSFLSTSKICKKFNLYTKQKNTLSKMISYGKDLSGIKFSSFLKNIFFKTNCVEEFMNQDIDSWDRSVHLPIWLLGFKVLEKMFKGDPKMSEEKYNLFLNAFLNGVFTIIASPDGEMLIKVGHLLTGCFWTLLFNSSYNTFINFCYILETLSSPAVDFDKHYLHNPFTSFGDDTFAAFCKNTLNKINIETKRVFFLKFGCSLDKKKTKIRKSNDFFMDPYINEYDYDMSTVDYLNYTFYKVDFINDFQIFPIYNYKKVISSLKQYKDTKYSTLYQASAQYCNLLFFTALRQFIIAITHYFYKKFVEEYNSHSGDLCEYYGETLEGATNDMKVKFKTIDVYLKNFQVNAITAEKYAILYKLERKIDRRKNFSTLRSEFKIDPMSYSFEKIYLECFDLEDKIVTNLYTGIFASQDNVYYQYNDVCIDQIFLKTYYGVDEAIIYSEVKDIKKLNLNIPLNSKIYVSDINTFEEDYFLNVTQDINYLVFGNVNTYYFFFQFNADKKQYEIYNCSFNVPVSTYSNFYVRAKFFNTCKFFFNNYGNYLVTKNYLDNNDLGHLINAENTFIYNVQSLDILSSFHIAPYKKLDLTHSKLIKKYKEAF